MILKLGIYVKYQQHVLSLNKTNIDERAITHLKDLYWLNPQSLNTNILATDVVLSTANFSYQEILAYIAKHQDSSKRYYIHSHLSDKILGDKGLV